MSLHMRMRGRGVPSHEIAAVDACHDHTVFFFLVQKNLIIREDKS